MSTSFDASSSAVASRPPGRGQLLQVLGMWFGIAAAIGNTIAAGIVRTPGDIARLLPNPWLFLLVWILGGLYALLGASSLAELGAAIPRSGGQYNFSRRALGEYGGFVVGWSDWLSTCGTNAAVAIVIGEYSLAFVPGLQAGSRHLLVKAIAVSILLFFAVLQWRGVKWGSGVQLATAALKTGAFVILVAACFVLGGHLREAAAAAAVPPPPLPAGWLLVIGFMLALQNVIYTVDGWDGIIYFSEEIKRPGRDVPRAIFGSVFSIMGIYLLLNAAVLYVLPMSEISGNDFALGAAANRVLGHYGDPIIRIIMIVSLLSCINACQMFSTRTLYAMSCDRLFFRQAARVNKGGTPVVALFLSTLVGITFILGSFERVIAMLSIFFVANYTLSYTSLFVLRKREPDMPRPYRAWGYPWSTAIALAASATFLVAAFGAEWQNNLPRINDLRSWWVSLSTNNSLLTVLLLALSYPLFRILKWASRDLT
ncbi:MAG: APC family permease [Acidobacteria bacterium]|nr:MAG: APC family permease [Acidobacteriota bacterium]